MLSKEEIQAIKKKFNSREPVCEQMISLFSLLSNKIRFRILCLLLEGDFCVTDIVDIIQIGKISNVSQQLKLLTMAGIIDNRRDKKQIFYRLKNEKIRDLVAFIQKNYLDMKNI
ncbi:MAG: winged helix-turn-helix transcriptional regulator [Candidatus Marinimicrobia bacterium]|nr:winged helix-turn-helix transcriptional regulator [Candidatus Neomarinimicrobiota bacterium]